MTGPDIQAENRRLRAELLRTREDLAHARERLGYAMYQVAELRRRLPDTPPRAAAPGTAPPARRDPLERFMEAIRPARA